MELKDWLNSINLTKKNLMDEDPLVEKDFPPFEVRAMRTPKAYT